MQNKPTVHNAGRYRLKYRGVECLNCGHPLDLSDKYCPNCSQANSTKKLSLLDFFEEFFSNVISYDSKLFKTLFALLLRPGNITREYLAGKRLSYTNPFRFLLSLAIVYFLLMGFNGDFETFNKFGTDYQQMDFNLEKEIEQATFENETERKEVLNALDSLKNQKFFDKRTDSVETVMLTHPKTYFNNIGEHGMFVRFFEKIDFFKLAINKDTISNYQQAVTTYELGSTIENKMSYSAAERLIEIEKRPGTFFNSLISKLPFATFFFLPIFSVFIWLMYIRKTYTYTDHLIFSFHNQSLLFILLIISLLLNVAFDISSEGFFLFIFSIYLYKAMRHFYGQGRVKTVLKYFILNTVFFILASLGILILITSSIFTY
ncbi:MAG: DUF3667 domain-containing protein [Maribacter sp.]